MSCRTTHSGRVALTLARAYSGLPDRDTQALFHSLKREGADLPEPLEDDVKIWRSRQRALLTHAPDGALTDRQRERLETELHRAREEELDGATFHAAQHIEVRARQEAVMNEIAATGKLVDLEPPGSQADQYSLDDQGRPTHVWYASYGSNMNRDRFMAYIEGGKVQGSGSRTSHYGSRDDTPPDGDIPIRFDGRMHYAYTSGRWSGGGVAFMDTDTAGHALGRAYHITTQQFEDVIAQENGRLPGATSNPDVPITEALTKGTAEYSRSIYGTLIHIGDYQGSPVLTFTGGFTAQDALAEAALWARGDKKADTQIATNEPHGNYLRMVAAGLKETFDMDDHQTADYLRGSLGGETWPRRELLRVLRDPNPIPEPEPITATPSSWTFGSGSSGKSWADDAAGKYGPGAPTFQGTGTINKPVQQTFDWRSPSRYEHIERTPAVGFSDITPTNRPIRLNKPCALCGNTSHDMHNCPTMQAGKNTRKSKSKRNSKTTTRTPGTTTPGTTAPTPIPRVPKPHGTILTRFQNLTRKNGLHPQKEAIVIVAATAAYTRARRDGKTIEEANNIATQYASVRSQQIAAHNAADPFTEHHTNEATAMGTYARTRATTHKLNKDAIKDITNQATAAYLNVIAAGGTETHAHIEAEQATETAINNYLTDPNPASNPEPAPATTGHTLKDTITAQNTTTPTPNNLRPTTNGIHHTRRNQPCVMCGKTTHATANCPDLH